ncbi:MAG: BamA/TamA family outer membrane protein [Bacteroidales bacterium]|nr:BamA/TamA family outer membrane protein [Bacteroidales bacterium]
MNRWPHILSIFAVATILLIMAACSTTRRIPEGEYLYTGLKGVDVVNYSDTTKLSRSMKEVLTAAVDVAPNKKMWHLFPVGLWVYNNWNVTDSTKGWKRRWYDNMVQEPVLVSDVRPQQRVKMLDQIMANNGYFRGVANYELVESKKNHKKASILYTVHPGPEYLIDSVKMIPDSTHLIHVIDSMAQLDSYLKPGVRFCMDSLSAARTRISNGVRNRGYYFFRPEYIEYLADSFYTRQRIDIHLDLASNTPKYALQRYRTGKVTMDVYRHAGGGEPDTIELKRLTLVQYKPSRLRTATIEDNVTFRPGKWISQRDINNTQSYLSRLGIFEGLNIEAVPDTTAKEPTVNINMAATFDMPLEVSLEGNVSSKSNSYLGPGLAVGVTNHNVFGGGEQLNVTLTGSYEWQTGHNSSSLFNSYEVGLTGSLYFPRLLAPKFMKGKRRYVNYTRLTLNADLLNRPHYFKMAQFNTSISYDWFPSKYVSNSWTPLKFTYTNLMHTTEAFDSIMAANQAIALSFQSQFIPQMIYTFTYNMDIDYSNTFNWTFTVQEAGNVVWAIYRLAGKKTGEMNLFGTPFSQFVKGSTQIVWGHRLGRTNQWLVSRVAVGAAHAYGNSSQVPYAEQFYCGGANSVRAFTARSIGPGSYHVPYAKGQYFDQTGTFKFEANVEYRFPIYGPLNGAIFLDAGNVWLLKKDDARPGGLLQGKTFFKDLATGTGVGLRFDIGMLVLRGDLGIGIHAPYDTGKSGYYNMTSFGSSLAFHLAIGYPF